MIALGKNSYGHGTQKQESVKELCGRSRYYSGWGCDQTTGVWFGVCGNNIYYLNHF